MAESGQPRGEQHQDPVERAFDLVVYAPLGLALWARDLVPPLLEQMAARGRAEVTSMQERASQQATQARMIGQFAIDQGGRMLRDALASRLGDARTTGEGLARLAGLGGRVPSHAPAPSAPPEAQAPETTPTGGRPDVPATGNGQAPGGPDAGALPIPDYDELSASQVVARLAGLGPDELDAIREYETSRRARKTVLTRIDQLTG